MKVCLNARIGDEYLKKADQILFDWRDRQAIPDYIDRYPDKDIVLTNNNDDDINWEEIKTLYYLSKGHFYFGFNRIALAAPARDHQISFFFTYPITSYDELNTVKDLGVCQVRLGAPLFFDLDTVKTYFGDLKIFAVPNIAYDDVYPRNDGVTGTWIRPEDMDTYAPYLDSIVFYDTEPRSRERALYRIYCEEKHWAGDLQDIITNLNYYGTNRMILPEVGSKRINCGQACKKTGNCHICYRALQLANPDLMAEYRDSKKQN